MLWSAGLNLIRDVLQFGQMLVLMRLLDPAVYGMAGITATVINFMGLFSFQHIIAHVLQVRGEIPINYHQHFTAGLAINGTLFVLANVVAFMVQFSPRYVMIHSLLHVMSLTFLLSVPADMRVKMLERENNWTRLRLLQMCSILVSVVAAIAMALIGAGVYALIVPGLLASLIFVADLFLRLRWRPHWRWQYSEYRDSLYFGVNRASSNALNGGRALLQNTLITQHFAFGALGLFVRAQSLGNLFCERVANEAGNALYPVITRTDAQSLRFQNISRLVLQSVAWVVIPIAIFLSLEAERVVTLLFGQKWVELIPLLPLAMAFGLSTSIGATAYRLLLANNQTRLCLRSDVIAFLGASAAMLVLVPYGLVAYLAGAAAVQFIIATLLVTLLVTSDGVRNSSLVNVLVPPAVGALAASSCVWFIGRQLAYRLPPLGELVISGSAFFFTYGFTLRMLFRAPLAELVSYLPGAQHVLRLLVLQRTERNRGRER